MTSPFTPGNLVAAYFRDSGGDTQELSISQQENAFHTWCTQNGLVPGAVFKDAARPGSSVIGRTGFHDMVHHFRSGQAKETGLVIWSYSRFARDFDDAQFYRADLRRRGYAFHSLNDDIPDGSIGRLFEAVIDWKNEQFLEDLSRDTRRGLGDLVKNYGAVPGTPPRGFKREPVVIGKRRDGHDHVVHRWVPDPDVIPKVRQAFAMRAAGKPLSEIHDTTHLYGSINSYKTFFTNRLYIGILDYGDQVFENYCEPMVDRPTWDAVQMIIQQYAAQMNMRSGSSRHPRRINSRYLLSGLLYCERCGSPMFGASSPQLSGKICDRYACTRAQRCRDCDMQPVPRKPVDQLVLNTLQEYILLPDVLEQHQQILETDQRQGEQRLAGERSEIRAQLVGIRRKIQNITAAIAESGHTRAMLEKLAGLEAEETSALAQATQLDQRINQPVFKATPDQFAQWATNIGAAIENAELETLQHILRGFIQRIVVDRQENQIIVRMLYYYPPQNSFDRAPPDDIINVSKSRPPLGAPLYRHIFTVTRTATIRAYRRRSR
jgi:site-specific DNA recombinase